jgi:hypothetical protein
VDALPLGVARHAVLKDKSAVKQGMFEEPQIPASRACLPDLVNH